MSIAERLEAEDAPSPSPSPSPSPVQRANEGFNRENTLFLIDLMRQHLESEGDGLPKTLKDLNLRLKNGRGNKKNLWKEAAGKLCGHFGETFCPDKVARKWNTLVDAYKKIKDNSKGTGNGSMRFQFFTEMDELLAGQHDIVFPVVGTSAGLQIRRPEVLGPESASASASASAPSPSPSSAPSSTPKRRRGQEDVLQFLRGSEETAQRRHEEAQRRHEQLLAQLVSAQQGFESLMGRLLDKM